MLPYIVTIKAITETKILYRLLIFNHNLTVLLIVPMRKLASLYSVANGHIAADIYRMTLTHASVLHETTSICHSPGPATSTPAPAVVVPAPGTP